MEFVLDSRIFTCYSAMNKTDMNRMQAANNSDNTPDPNEFEYVPICDY